MAASLSLFGLDASSDIFSALQEAALAPSTDVLALIELAAVRAAAHLWPITDKKPKEAEEAQSLLPVRHFSEMPDSVRIPGGARGPPVLMVTFPSSASAASREETSSGSSAIAGSRAACRYLHALDSDILSQADPIARHRFCMSQARSDAWIEYFDAELAAAASVWILPILGVIPNNADAVLRAKSDVRAVLKSVEDHLFQKRGPPSNSAGIVGGNDYSVGEQMFLVDSSLTPADVLCALLLAPLFVLVLDPVFRKPFRLTTEWYQSIMCLPEVAQAVGGVLPLCDKMRVPPKPYSERPAAAAAVRAVPKKTGSVFDMSKWKKVFSESADVRKEAVPWFWDHFNADGWSIWLAEYGGPALSDNVQEATEKLEGWLGRLGAAVRPTPDLQNEIFGSLAVLRDPKKPDVLQLSGCWIFKGQAPPKQFVELEDMATWSMMMLDPRDAVCRGTVNDFVSWEGKFSGREFVLGKKFL